MFLLVTALLHNFWDLVATVLYWSDILLVCADWCWWVLVLISINLHTPNLRCLASPFLEIWLGL